MSSSAGFPTGGSGSIIIGSEQIDYAGLNGNILTGVTRGAGNTAAAPHTDEASVNLLKWGVCIYQNYGSYIWGNTGFANNDVYVDEMISDNEAPYYNTYDIQSYTQRPSNWQYRNDGTAYSYTPYPHPHPLRLESLQTCFQMGGTCCSGSQTCSGSLQSSSDCLTCCTGTCRIPSCGDTFCDPGETCSSCPQDCPTPGGQVCCSGQLYPGNCCSSSACPQNYSCIGNACTQVTAPSGGLVLAYSFDQASGSSVPDYSGNGNTGTLTNGPAWSAGKYNNSLAFDGVNDYVNIPNSPSIDISGKNLTIAFWAQITDLSGDDVLIGKPWNPSSMSSPWYQYGIEFSGGNKQLDFYLGDTSGSIMGPFSMTPSLGTWTHVAFTYDGTNVKGYLDGVQKFSTSETRSIQARGNSLRIGVDGSYGQPYIGKIDNLRIYNRSLSQAEILGDMNAPVGQSCHRSDTNCDSCVSMTELTAFIDRWKVSNADVTIRELIEAIGLWKRGC